jgi:RNA-directed DNA polymerase
VRFPRATRHCKDSNRRAEFASTSFTFLGYTFRPRESKSGKNGTIFTSFQPAISPVALKDKSQQVRRLRIHRHTTTNLEELAKWINPIVRGWMNYYGEFNRCEMYSLLQRVNTYLMRWARKKFKRLRAYKRFKAWWQGLIEREPEMFDHWAWIRAFSWIG